VIATILSHLQSTAPGQYSAELPLGARAPPGQATNGESRAAPEPGMPDRSLPGSEAIEAPDAPLPEGHRQHGVTIQWPRDVSSLVSLTIADIPACLSQRLRTPH
jgi:hypothetical protein